MNRVPIQYENDLYTAIKMKQNYIAINLMFCL